MTPRRRAACQDATVLLEVDAINALVAGTYPSAHTAGYSCQEVGEGFALARWPYDSTELRPGGLISGSTQFTLADMALWYLSFTVVGLEPMAVTSDLNIHFVRPAIGGDLMARAELVRAGKTKIVGLVRLWVDGQPERTVSTALGSYQLLG